MDELNRQYKKLDRLIKTYSEHAQELTAAVKEWELKKKQTGEEIGKRTER